MSTTELVKPHPMFETWTPDEFAECVDGIPSELYQKLWSCVDKYDNRHRENIEDIGPSDVIGINNTVTWWNEFTAEEQKMLNGIALAHDARIAELMKG